MSRNVRAAVAALAVLGALVLAACGATSSSRFPTRPTVPPPSPSASSDAAATRATPYVALGDSYAAAPGVLGTALAGGCIRSDHNYPHLLAAAEPQLRLTDVTCSGATTGNLTARQRILDVSVPPQLDAVTSATRLVTLGIGGNDFRLFGRVLDRCLRGQSDCLAGTDVRADVGAIGQRIVEALHRIHRRAPQAHVVLVGYPQLIGNDDRGCDRLQADPAVLATVHRLIADFGTMMGRAATRGRATYVDLIGPSAGHDICSSHPWINGSRSDSGAVAFHPLLVEQQAVAGLVRRTLG